MMPFSQRLQHSLGHSLGMLQTPVLPHQSTLSIAVTPCSPFRVFSLLL